MWEYSQAALNGGRGPGKGKKGDGKTNSSPPSGGKGVFNPKTEFCNFMFQYGSCKHGDNCKFSHDPEVAKRQASTITAAAPAAGTQNQGAAPKANAKAKALSKSQQKKLKHMASVITLADGSEIHLSPDEDPEDAMQAFAEEVEVNNDE